MMCLLGQKYLWINDFSANLYTPKHTVGNPEDNNTDKTMVPFLFMITML
jgi:hypothetical protein